MEREPLRRVLRRPLMVTDVGDLLCGQTPDELPREAGRRETVLHQADINRVMLVTSFQEILKQKEVEERSRQVIQRQFQ